MPKFLLLLTLSLIISVFFITAYNLNFQGKSFSSFIDDSNKNETAYFNNKKVELISESTNILGESNTNKSIEVDLTNQRVYAYEGDTLIYNFLISSGKWNTTPTGNFKIWAKVRSQKMSGGSKKTRYILLFAECPLYFIFLQRSG